MTSFSKNVNWIRVQLINKYMGLEERFLYWISESKIRLRRMVLLFVHGMKYSVSYKANLSEPEKKITVFNWFGTLMIYFLELTGLPGIYETLTEFFKFNTRVLNQREISLAKSVFGENLNYELIRWDKKAFFGAKTNNVAYVSFHTINSWGNLPADIFIHELVHIWQYEQIGAVYIPRALAAQKTKEGYNYGGLEILKKNEYKGLAAFNLEQQADIIADYFRIKNDQKPEWGNATKSDLSIYERYVSEVRGSSDVA